MLKTYDIVRDKLIELPRVAIMEVTELWKRTIESNIDDSLNKVREALARLTPEPTFDIGPITIPERTISAANIFEMHKKMSVSVGDAQFIILVAGVPLSQATAFIFCNSSVLRKAFAETEFSKPLPREDKEVGYGFQIPLIGHLKWEENVQSIVKFAEALGARLETPTIGAEPKVVDFAKFVRRRSQGIPRHGKT